MAVLTEQERIQKQEWHKRQAAPLHTLPEYPSGGMNEGQGDDAEQSEQENPEPESAVEEDQAQRALYQERRANQDAEAQQQSAAAEEQEQAASAGETQEPPKDNLILFFATLFVAVLKDFLDLIGIETLGLLGSFINIFISGIFALILMLRGSKLNNNKTIIRYIIACIAEFIPFVNFLPMWTIAVIWEKLEKKLPAGMQVVSKATNGKSGSPASSPTNIQQLPPPAQEEESDENTRMAA